MTLNTTREGEDRDRDERTWSQRNVVASKREGSLQPPGRAWHHQDLDFSTMKLTLSSGFQNSME